ncbi:hypothetical protein KUCAC02_036594 [Chaenocephalus aceratus]|nr:hypothetical protein KUCAC02_036594 [Chaenocephalus aceratus]
MERTRAARKSEWLRSALAHHHCPDPGVENEIVVLASGIDQYLQEVFHHLAVPNREDTVSAEDFSALCAVLRIPGKRKIGGEKDEENEEFAEVCSVLPSQLSFKDFHSRLCGYFRVRSARRGDCAWRLPVTEDTELVQRQIRVRWPRVRRRKCVSFDLERDHNRPENRGMRGRGAEDRSESDEVAALRELVEDLRSGLQGSDARCLALEQRIKGQCSGSGGDAARTGARRQEIRDPLIRELKLIRSSRDGQLEEAMKFNERMEEELRWAYQEVQKLHGVESALRKENAQIRRRAEEAREALSQGLQRVRMIQQEAQCVPQLQTTITQLETELQQCRSRCTCIPDPNQHMYPIGEEDACDKTEAGCLQRAVEGKDASDEEEDDRGMREEGQGCVLEVKKSRLHSCGKGCQSHKGSQSHLHDRNFINTFKDSRGRYNQKGPNQEQPEGGSFEKDKRPKEEEDKTRPEEKTRLSLLEDKLTDALTLLLQLRNKNVSRRTLGKIVMDTLDVCRTGDGPCQVLQVADALCLRLSSRDLLGIGGDDEGGEGEKGLVSSSGCQTSSGNPLLISC